MIKMNRRSFIKRIGMLVGIAYVTPTALIPKTTEFISLGTGNVFMTPAAIAKESLTLLESHLTFTTNYIKPAMIQLADNVDKAILKEIL